MDWLTFFSKFTESLFLLISKLAWPVVVLAIFYIGRERIFSLLSSLRSIKYDKFQADFEADTIKVAHKAEELVPEQEAVENNDRYQQLRKYLEGMDSISSIVTAWNLIEKAIKNAVARSGLDVVIESKSDFKNSKLGVTHYMRTLLKNHLITKEQYELVSSMRVLRNQAVHISFGDMPTSALENYVDSSLSIISFLDSVKIDLNNHE